MNSCFKKKGVLRFPVNNFSSIRIWSDGDFVVNESMNVIAVCRSIAQSEDLWDLKVLIFFCFSSERSQEGKLGRRKLNIQDEKAHEEDSQQQQEEQ